MSDQDTSGHGQTQAETNLHQAADIEQSSGWVKARLIASSVEQQKRGPKSSVPQGTKLGTTEAATAMRWSKSTIIAYLKSWDAAAADGQCVPSSDLAPDDGWSATLPAAELWEQYRNPNSHSTKPEASTIPSDPIEAAQSASERMTSDQRREFVADQIKSDPVIASAADNALDERYTESEVSTRHAASKERREHEAKQMHGVQYTSVVVKIRKAIRAITEAQGESQGVTFTDEERDSIQEFVNELNTGILDLADQVGGINWDAALAELSGGEQ